MPSKQSKELELLEQREIESVHDFPVAEHEMTLAAQLIFVTFVYIMNDGLPTYTPNIEQHLYLRNSSTKRDIHFSNFCKHLWAQLLELKK